MPATPEHCNEMSTRAYLVVCGGRVSLVGLGSLRRPKEGVSVPCVGGLGGEQIIKLSLDALRERGQLLASGPPSGTSPA